jgi:hypothetical protein
MDIGLLSVGNPLAARVKTLAHWRQNEKAEKPAYGLLSAGSDAPVSQNLFQGFLLT